MTRIEIEHGTACIFRQNNQDDWKPGFLKTVRPELSSFRPFISMENNHYAECAPLEGNEQRIGQIDDAFELWDAERVVKEGREA